MYIISRKAFVEFGRSHPNAKRSLDRFYKLVCEVRWTSFDDVRKTFSNVDKVEEYLIFNIGGNDYRLIAKISHYCYVKPNGEFNDAAFFVKKILTHAEYDRLVIPRDLR